MLEQLLLSLLLLLSGRKRLFAQYLQIARATIGLLHYLRGRLLRLRAALLLAGELLCLKLIIRICLRNFTCLEIIHNFAAFDFILIFIID